MRLKQVATVAGVTVLTLVFRACPCRCAGNCVNGKGTYWVLILFWPTPGGQETTDLEYVRRAARELRLGERLRDAIADTAADDAVSMFFGVWSDADGLSYLEAVDAVSEIPEALKEQFGQSVADLAPNAVPVSVSGFTGDVAATLILKPITQPIGKLVRIAEMAGLVIGLLTGFHPLAVACAKRLAVGSLTSRLADGLNQALTDLSDPEAIFRVEAISEVETTAGFEEPDSMFKRQREALFGKHQPQEKSDMVQRLLEEQVAAAQASEDTEAVRPNDAVNPFVLPLRRPPA